MGWKDEYPDDAPEGAADPRPGGRPYFIDGDCPDCGTPLVLYDAISDEALRESNEFPNPELANRDGPIWHDEFVCPSCLGGVHMDWPHDACSECGEETAIQFMDSQSRCGACIPESEVESLETVSKDDIEESLSDMESE